MSRLMQQNIKALVFTGLVMLIGYCLGGRIGLGIASTIVLIIQFI